MNKFIKLSFMLSLTLLVFACKSDKAQKAGAAQEVTTASGNAFKVDLTRSNIVWEGSKPTGSHTGLIKLSAGNIDVKDGEVVGGKFTIDMNSIESTDLNGDARANLEAHLKGTAEGKEDHFFNVAKYPTAEFEVSSIKKLINNPDASHLVYGNLTMKGQTKSVSFQAQISNRNGQGFGIRSSNFYIDRTDWGINFNSKSVFDNLKDNFINDKIKLQVNVLASK